MTETTEQQSRPQTLRDLLDPELMAKLDRLDVFSRKIFLGKLRGERRSKRRGRSVEFADYRNYVVGDDLRFIDWNIYGRLDRLFLKLFLEEEDLSVHVIFDASASMAEGDPPKDIAAKRLAAALGYIGLVNNNRLTVSAFSEGIVAQKSNLRGRHRVATMAELLLSSQPEGFTEFERSARQIALTRQGKGVAILISDFLMKEGYERGLRYLIGRSYDLYVVQILSPQELDPTISGDLRLVDIEDNDTAEVTISAPLLKRYKATVAAYCNEMREFCTKRGVTYLCASSATAVETLVLDYLRRRGLLR